MTNGSNKLPILAFGNKSPDVFRYTEVYDPDVDGLDVNNSGKHVPSVYSFVIDDRKGAGEFTVYQVVAVDPETHKVTLAAPKIPIGGWTEIPEVLTYGRTDYALFYDNRNPDRVALHVDSTLLVAGKQLQWFRITSASYGNVISRPISNENRITVANIAARDALDDAQIGRGVLVLVIDASDDPEVGSGSESYTLDMTSYTTGKRKWVRIYGAQGMCSLYDVYKSTVEGVDYVLKQCMPCVATTGWTLSQGDQYILEIFDQAGALCVQLQITATPGTLLGDQTLARDPIVGFKVDPPVGMGWEVPVGFNMDNFNITPMVTFASGKKITIPIDNQVCFAYGLANVETKVAGKEYPVIFKYWPRADIPVHVENAPRDVPFLSTVATVKIVEYSDRAIRSISAIPQLIGTKHQLNVAVYYESGITPTYYTYQGGNIIYTSSKFDGTIHEDPFYQEFSYTVTAASHIEAIKMQTEGPDETNPIILQYNDELEYGVGDIDPKNLQDKNVRPTLNYHTPNGSDPASGMYSFELEKIEALVDAYIAQNPISGDEAAQAAYRASEMKKQFLQNFLYNAAASILLLNEVPTHFRVVYPDGRVLTSAPIPINNFITSWAMSLPMSSTGETQDLPTALLGNGDNIIGTRFVNVEFLQSSTTMRYLFGVPVLVRAITAK